MSIILHPGQSEVFEDLFVKKEHRYSVVVCSRGWGKSYLAAVAAVNAVWELMRLHPKVPNKNVYIVAPTYNQVVDIYFPLIAYELGMSDYCKRMSKDAGKFWFPNNVELRLVSYEAIERLRGHGAYLVVMDEVSSWSKGSGLKDAWQDIIQPCIATRWSPKRAAAVGATSAGRALVISTPKGYNFLYDMYNFREGNTYWKSYHYDYKSSPYLDVAEIEQAENDMDPLSFNREYKASFEESGNNVFYCFDRKIHVTDNLLPFREAADGKLGEDVHVNIDFNVNLQCTSVMAIRGDQVHFLDEFKGAPDTERLAIAIRLKYPKEKHKVFAYPDPSGRSKKTSAVVGQTDFTILQNADITCLAHSAAPPIVDSVNAVNRMLKTAKGKVSMYIHPRCKGTIQSLERTTWVENNPDSATIDKKAGIEHYSDGIRYGIEYNFPIRRGTSVVSRGTRF